MPVTGRTQRHFLASSLVLCRVRKPGPQLGRRVLRKFSDLFSSLLSLVLTTLSLSHSAGCGLAKKRKKTYHALVAKKRKKTSGGVLCQKS